MAKGAGVVGLAGVVGGQGGLMAEEAFREPFKGMEHLRWSLWVGKLRGCSTFKRRCCTVAGSMAQTALLVGQRRHALVSDGGAGDAGFMADEAVFAVLQDAKDDGSF